MSEVLLKDGNKIVTIRNDGGDVIIREMIFDSHGETWKRKHMKLKQDALIDYLTLILNIAGQDA